MSDCHFCLSINFYNACPYTLPFPSISLQFSPVCLLSMRTACISDCLTNMSVYLSDSLNVLSVHLSMSTSLHLAVFPFFIHPSVYISARVIAFHAFCPYNVCLPKLFLSVCQSVCLPDFLSVYLSVCLYMSVRMSKGLYLLSDVVLSICLPVCLYIY